MLEQQVRLLLEELRAQAAGHGDGVYGNLKLALADLDALLADTNLVGKEWQIRILIAPTANLQDLSLDCGWGDSFLKLSAELDRLLAGSA